MKQISKKMQQFFENLEWKRFNLFTWQIINIVDIITINSILFMTECVRKLINEMNQFQRNLDPAHHNTMHFRKNFIRICWDNSTLLNDFINLFSESFALINNLYNFTVNYETVHKSNQTGIYFQNDNDGDDEHDCETYFTNKQYRDKSFCDRDKNDDEFRSFRIFDISSRSSTVKLCFVCGKDWCWFINHTQQKRETAKQKFTDQQFRFKDKSELLQRWIIKAEETFDDDKIIAFFEELSIETIDDFNPKSATTFESYFIFIKQFQSSNAVMIVNVLIDHVFKHRLISFDNIINLNPNFIALASYIFSIFSNIRYDNTKFKDLLIDFDASTMSIDGMGQLKVLQQLNASILLNKSLIDSIIFIFGIGSISSIETTILRIFLKAIIFHIVSINTSFLLCFVDMNQLNAYFNNVINQII